MDEARKEGKSEGGRKKGKNERRKEADNYL